MSRIKVKWHIPGNGSCEYADIGNYRYFVTQEVEGGSWLLKRRKIIKQEKRRFKTYRELYIFLTGYEPLENPGGGKPSERDTEARLRLITFDACTSENLRGYNSEDHKHIAVDFSRKEAWEYSEIEKASPEYDTPQEAREHAERWFSEDDGQLSLFDGEITN